MVFSSGACCALGNLVIGHRTEKLVNSGTDMQHSKSMHNKIFPSTLGSNISANVNADLSAFSCTESSQIRPRTGTVTDGGNRNKMDDRRFVCIQFPSGVLEQTVFKQMKVNE